MNAKNEQSLWVDCTQKYICDQKLSKSNYRPVKSDPEYLNNWVDKLDLLCKPKHEIGYLGSSFFFGIVSSVIWVPLLSDKYGRSPLIIFVLSLQLVAYSGLYLTTSLKMAYVCLACLGMTFPGKHIVCFNYVLEITPTKYQQSVVNAFVFLETFAMIAISFIYQFISNNVKYPQLVGIIFTCFAVPYTSLFFYESPKFYHDKKEFAKARESLKRMAKFNGTELEEFRFECEVEDEDREALETLTTDHEEALSTHGLDTSQSLDSYYVNMFKMTVMWCSSSFSSYLLNYMNKYLEGSIFENHYNEGIAGCIACFIGASIYAKLGKRFAFITSYSLALVGGLMILVLEGSYY